MSDKKRNRLFADHKVQGALIKRLVGYWFFAWLVVLGLALLVAVLFGMAADDVSIGQAISRILANLWLPILISIMVLPVLVRDCLRLSNRFAGPVLRLRRGIKQLADGETAQPIKLRTGDFWQELADDFNRVVERFQPTEASSDTSQT